MAAPNVKRQVTGLANQLTAHGMSPLSGADNVVVRAGGETWWMVYRRDSYGDAIWDLFPDWNAPGPGKYGDQIADDLKSTNEVVDFLKFQDRPDVAAVLAAVEDARKEVAYDYDLHTIPRGDSRRASLDSTFDDLRDKVIKAMGVK